MISLRSSLFLLMYFSGALCRSMKDLPSECFDAEEIDDSTRAFDVFDTPTSKANDLNLKKGWYRILGKAGNSLKQGFEKVLNTGDSPPNFCGTVHAGSLMGDHPTEEEGMVEMSVCFRDRFCYFHNVRTCECKSKIKIYVRNCRKHFIYWLSPTSSNQRYCTGRTSLAGPKVVNKISKAIECSQYTIMKDLNSRVWDQVGDVTCDQNVGWFRFDKASGYEISSKCTVNAKSLTRIGQSCSAEFRGWMVDRHPTLEEGRVSRRICFSYAAHCVCDFFGQISVRNCGQYYVYRLQKAPICNARYCGAANGSLAAVNDPKKPAVEKNKDICKMYQTSYDPDRLWSYTIPTVNKCDASFYGRYRFGSIYTPWSIKEGCNTSDMHLITHRCGSTYQGFMEGKHPAVEDGYVERVICFQSTKVPCECKHTTIVGVKNCGKYFVYDFKSVPECNSRFCMVANGSAEITIDPGRPTLYPIPAPGYTPPPAEKEVREDKNSSLITSTTVLAIILLIVIILVVLLIFIIVCMVWPIYRQHEPRVRRESSELSQLVTPVEVASEAKPSGSNGQIYKEEKVQNFEETPIPPYPSVPPPETPDKAELQEVDSDIEMQKGPGSEDDLNTIPEDTEYSDTAEESDTLMKRKDSAV
ncbi:uncharacterized protein LOC130654316 [Hydractinia symbiolongicarpus]|uniref:uncharacterized protein LOC130654316 n=1 Tax=Hydractinia symbiolongicarpus TaxID=13093 RepID=UPI002551B9B4|nr:uncharacterized protein LOC130654316 [Hydractinia symbiolongicarpus]